MKWMSRFKLAAFTAVLIAIKNTAFADTVNYNFTGLTQGGVEMNLQVPEGNVSVPVGQFIMTTTAPGYSSSLPTYCTDVNEWIQSSFNYTPTPLSSATGASPTWVSGGGVNAATLWFHDQTAATSATQTAGLQLAIWELLYNPLLGSYNVSTLENSGNGGFYVTSTDPNSMAAMNYAVGLLNNFGSLGTVSNQVEWLAPTESGGSFGGSQGLFYEVSSVPDATSTFGLFGIAAIVLAVAHRKFAAQN